MEEMVVWWGWLGGIWLCGGGCGIGLMMDVVEWCFLYLLLFVKDIDSVLQLCEPHPLSIDMLSVSIGALGDGLPPHDGFMLLLEPLYFLWNPGQLLFFCCSFISFIFLILILHLDLVELNTALDIL
jgi:hypothetical protein